jgi:hypothetical protein
MENKIGRKCKRKREIERERDLLKPFEIYFIGALSTQYQFKTSKTSVYD